MDKQFVDVGIFDTNTVDCKKTPSTAEEYLRQVIVGRSQIPDYVVYNVPEKLRSKTTQQQKKIKTDPRAVQLKWIEAKSQDFSRKRRSVQAAPPSKKKFKLPPIGAKESYHAILLETCIPELQDQISKFPNQIGTPPALSFITNLTQPQVHNLIEYIAEWAETDSFSRPLREWLYALMLVVDVPLLHDVVAALRSIAKMCRKLRSEIPIQNAEDIAEMSLFIALISHFFGQKDLSD